MLQDGIEEQVVIIPDRTNCLGLLAEGTLRKISDQIAEKLQRTGKSRRVKYHDSRNRWMA